MMRVALTTVAAFSICGCHGPGTPTKADSQSRRSMPRTASFDLAFADSISDLKSAKAGENNGAIVDGVRRWYWEMNGADQGRARELITYELESRGLISGGIVFDGPGPQESGGYRWNLKGGGFVETRYDGDFHSITVEIPESGHPEPER